MTQQTNDPVRSSLNDLEIKDAQLIFESVWQDLEADFGRENLRFPKEIILLGGAPGAGKGTNTAFIAKTRSLTCGPIVISALLDSPEARALKNAGHMVGDREVVGLLLRELLRPEYHDGVIIDGFPRTTVQVECLKLLVDRDARAAARVLQHAAQHPFPASDHPHHGVVRRREGIDRAPAETRPRNARPQRGSAAHRRRPAARGSAHRPRRGAGAAALPGVQGADLGRAPVAGGNLPLPLRQRPGARSSRSSRTSCRSSSTRARSSSIRAPWNGCAACRWRARSSCTRARNW